MDRLQELKNLFSSTERESMQIGILHGVAEGLDEWRGFSFSETLNFFAWAAFKSMAHGFDEHPKVWSKALQFAITKAFPEGPCSIASTGGVSSTLTDILMALSSRIYFRGGFKGQPYEKQTTAFLQTYAESCKPSKGIPAHWYNAAIASENFDLVWHWAGVYHSMVEYACTSDSYVIERMKRRISSSYSSRTLPISEVLVPRDDQGKDEALYLMRLAETLLRHMGRANRLDVDVRKI